MSKKLIKKFLEPAGTIKRKEIWDEATGSHYLLGSDGYYQIPIDGVIQKVSEDGMYDPGDGTIQYFDVDQVKPTEIVQAAPKQEAPAPTVYLSTDGKKLLPGESTPENFLVGKDSERWKIYLKNLQEYVGDDLVITEDMAKLSLNTAVTRMNATPASVMNLNGNYTTPWYATKTTETNPVLTPFEKHLVIEEQDQKTPGYLGHFNKNFISDVGLFDPDNPKAFATSQLKNLNDLSNTSKSYIDYLIDSDGPLWKKLTAHERTHSLLLKASENAIKNRNLQLRAGVLKDAYLDNPKEVYARTKQVQVSQDMDPNHVYTIDELKPILQKSGNDDLLNRYTDEDLEFLFNDVAYNAPTQQYPFKNLNEGVAYVKNGNRLIPKHLEGTNTSGIKRLDIEALKQDPEYKSNYNWHINAANVEALQDSLIGRNAGYPQRLATLAMVIPENGGNTTSHGNGAHGLVGWRGDRAINLPKNFDGQAHKLMVELFDNPTGKDWTHGGKGTGVMSGREMYELFNSTPNVNQATNAIMKGYVRPEYDEHQKRINFVQLLKKYMK